MDGTGSGLYSAEPHGGHNAAREDAPRAEVHEPDPPSPYDDDFYDDYAGAASRSASAMVPRIVEALGPKTVVDVGCGEGFWVREFLRAGCERVVGIDGEQATSRAHSLIGSPSFVACDLASADWADVSLIGGFDLAICLEVAEHLPPARADAFVSFLATLADVILFGAAIPFQGGTDHQNEQWPTYWIEKFRALGYSASTAVRRELWMDPNIEFWYRQNTLIFYRHHLAGTRDWFDGSLELLHVVHPDLWLAFMTEANRRITAGEWPL